MLIQNSVRKPVDLIFTKSKLGLVERKMYNVLLANAASNLNPGVKHTIGLGFLCKCMGYHSHDYDLIKNKFKNLRRYEIDRTIFDEEGKSIWTNTSFLSWVKITEREAICEYEFPSGLVPYLRDPAVWAKISLLIQARFKSLYGLILFEICERYKKVGRTAKFTISQFRDVMCLDNDEYPDFFALNNRVIKKAISEVNTHADVKASVKFEKKARKVDRIQFLLSEKETKLEKNKEDTDEDFLKEKLKNDFDMSSTEVTEWLKKYSSDYILEKINYVLNTGSFKEGKVKNLVSYLRICLENDYKKGKSSAELLEEKRQEMEIEKQLQLAVKTKEENIRVKYQEYKHRAILSCYQKASKAIQLEIRNAVWAKLEATLKKANPGIYNSCVGKGEDSPIFKGELFKILQESYTQFTDNLLNFEQFKNSSTADVE